MLVTSEDQEDLLLSSAFVSGLSAKKGGTSKGEKVVVGNERGVLTLWEKGVWDDQDERIMVDRGWGPGGGESLDVITALPDGVGGGGKHLAVGLGNGSVRFVKLGMNKVVDTVSHDDLEGVIAIGFDVQGRMITGGGSTVKVWHEKVDEDNGGYVDGGEKRGADSDSDADSDEDSEADSSDDEDKGRKKRKKRKRNKGPQQNGAKSSLLFSGLD